MQRTLIITTNCALLVLLLIGIPAITRAQLGNWQISSASAARLLTYWGLALAAAANFIGAIKLIKVRKEKIICWEWMVIFCLLLLAQFAFTRGYFNFDWLQHSLLWLQKHFQGII